MIYRSTRRRQNPQYAMLWRVFLSLFALIFVAGGCYSALIYWITSEPPTTVYLNIVEAWGRLGVFIFVGNLITLMIAGAISAVIALYINNKSSAPLHRLEELCEQIADGGELDALNITVEKGQFRKLSFAFRQMVNKLYLRRVEQEEYIDKIYDRIQELRSGLNLTGSQRDVLNELEMQLQQLEKIT
jgi:methyl-accepting chemotaxis protein